MSNNTQKTKYAALVTYVIVLICMIVSFFIPVFDGSVSLFRELPGALGAVLGKSYNLPSYFVQFGLTSHFSFNVAALAVLIYTIVTILAIIGLVVVILLDSESRAAVAVVYSVEILAIVSLLIFAFDRLTLIAYGGYASMQANEKSGWLLIALLCVIWFIYTMQSIRYKGGAGFAKSILFVLSLAGFVCLFLNAAAYKGGWINNVADWLNASYYFMGNYSAISLLTNSADAFGRGAAYGAAFITAIVVMINLFIDVLSIAVKSNIASKTFNIVRYGIEFILTIITAIIGAVNGISPGIYLYVLMLIVLLQIVISTIRMFTRATFEQSAEYSYDSDEEVEKDLTSPADAPKATAADGYYVAPDTTQIPAPVYTRSYAYQDDSFLNSLSPSERAEFYAIFIDKRRGNFYFLPEYEIGGENKEFFQSLFIYLGKIMGTISDGLMNKIYRRLNMLS